MSAPVLSQLGNRIREVREGRRLTQSELATRLNMEIGNYQRIEHGKQNPTVLMLARIADALEVPIRSFFTAPRTTRAKPGRPPKR